MNRTIIYTRTAEGAREAATPTQELARNLGALLKAIDGKSSVDALLCKFDYLSPVELGNALSALTDKNLICLAGVEATIDGGSVMAEEGNESSSLSSAETLLKAQQLRAKIKAKREDDSLLKDGQVGPDAHAAAERVRSEIEAQVRREMEEEARRNAEVDARRKAAERVRQEAEERVRQEVTERVRRELDERIRQEEAERIRQEEAEARARSDAEEGARRDAEERARQVARENVGREAEDRARQEADVRARQVAEERAWRETEERIRREEEEAAATRAKAKLASRDRKAGLEIVAKWGKVITLGLVVLLVLGVVAMHLISFDGQIPGLEKSMEAQFQQPVKIGALRISLLPRTHLRLEDVSIGGEGQVRIPKVRAVGGVGNLFGHNRVFTSIELESPVLGEEALNWFLFGKPRAQHLLFGKLSVSGGTLTSKYLALSPFDATIQSDGDGTWKSMVLESQDKNVGLELTSKGESAQFEFKAKAFRVPFGSKLGLDEMVASGTVNSAGLVLKEFKGFAYGGTLGGNATLTWGASWSLGGDLNVKQMDTLKLIPGVLDSARVAATATYSMQAPEAAKLFAAPRLEGNFAIPRGTLLGVDMGRMFQAGDIRGETKFTELTGSFVHELGALQLREMRLSQGTMTASGAADVDAGGNVRGRFAVDLKLSTEQRRANLVAAGTIKKIEWQRQ